MNQLSDSIGANSRIKTVKFSRKFSNHNHPYLINHVPTPRKPRSAIKSEIPNSQNGLKDCTKRQKASQEEFKGLKDNVLTKEDKEAAQALFALADSDFKITSEVEPFSMQPEPPYFEMENDPILPTR